MFRKFSSRKLSLTSAACAAVAVAALAFWPAWSSNARADGPGDDPPTNPVFARSVAGTWVEWFEGGQTMFNIRADGTHDWFGSWFFGDGTENYYDGPVYCSWRQTGPREITTIEVGFLFNGDGSFFGTGRVIQVITFDQDFQSFSYMGTEDVFLPDQDPADPNAVPFVSFSFGPFGPVNRLNFMD